MSTIARQVPCKEESEVRNVAVDFTDELDAGELLTGTPTVTEATLTIGNIAINTAPLTINGRTVAIGAAVQFNVSGGTATTTYDIKVSVDTDATPAQTLLTTCKLLVVPD